MCKIIPYEDAEHELRPVLHLDQRDGLMFGGSQDWKAPRIAYMSCMMELIEVYQMTHSWRRQSHWDEGLSLKMMPA